MSKSLFYEVFDIVFCRLHRILTFANFHGDRNWSNSLIERGTMRIHQYVKANSAKSSKKCKKKENT